MPVTRHGPASMAVTRSTRPSSPKTWVIPSFLPSSAAISPTLDGRRPSMARKQEATRAQARERPMTQPGDGIRSYELDLDVNTRREMVESLERVDGLRRRLMDIDQPLVGA